MHAMPSPTANDLKNISVFAPLSESDRKLLAQHLQVEDFPAGTALMTAGDINESFFVLHAGEVDVTVNGERRRTLYPGAFFGELSLENDAPASASLIARTPVQVYVLDRAHYQTVIANPDAGLRIRTIMTDRRASDRLFG